jgi:CRP/FNR family transcriptional regulator
MVVQKSGFLKIFPYFRNAPEALVDNILSSSKYASAPENLILKEEGAEVSEFVLLLSGEKRVYKASGIGRELTLYEMGPGDICVLNASCLLANTRLPANAASLTKVEFLLMPSSDFLDIMTRYMEMRSFVFSRISDSFVSIMSLIAEVTFGKMDERLSDYLTEKSENCRLRTTHQKIADDLGTSREVVSRLLKEFERQGMVRLSRNSIELKIL